MGPQFRLEQVVEVPGGRVLHRSSRDYDWAVAHGHTIKNDQHTMSFSPDGALLCSSFPFRQQATITRISGAALSAWSPGLLSGGGLTHILIMPSTPFAFVLSCPSALCQSDMKLTFQRCIRAS